MEAEKIEQISPEKMILTYLDGAPGMEFDFVRFSAEGKRQKTRIRIQYLKGEESLSSLKDAQDHAQQRGEHQGYGDIYNEAKAYEVIRRALRHPNKVTRPDGTTFYPPIFTDTRELRMSYNEGEMAVLLNCYHIVKATFSTVESLEEQDAEVLIAKLSDPLRGPFFLAQLDSLHWPACILLLAGILRDFYQEAGLALPSLEPTSASGPASSTEGTGSSGRPPSASSTQGTAIEVGATQITQEQAREIVRRRQKKE